MEKFNFDMSPFQHANTSVLWDVGDCPIPYHLSPDDVVKNIESSLHKKGYYGEVSISVYGTSNQLEDFDDDDFASFETEDREETRDSILTDFIFCGIPYKMNPLNVLLIVGDLSDHLGFIAAIHAMKSERKYNILLAQPVIPNVLLDACPDWWFWNLLATDGRGDPSERSSPIRLQEVIMTLPTPSESTSRVTSTSMSTSTTTTTTTTTRDS